MAQCRDLLREAGRVAKSYLRKGSKVYLEGQLETRKWQDQSGNDRYTTEVVLRISAATWCCSTAVKAVAAAAAHSTRISAATISVAARRSKPQSRPQPAAFDTDLDDDVPILGASSLSLPQLGEHRERARLLLRQHAGFPERGIRAGAPRIGVEAERERVGDAGRGRLPRRRRRRVAVGFAKLDLLVRRGRSAVPARTASRTARRHAPGPARR